MTDKDEYAKVLDFLEHGKGNDRDERVAQVIGTNNYTLLELVMREDHQPRGGEELYIGDGDREKVEFIKQRINYDDLTGSAQSELKYVLQSLIKENEDEFVEFFNNATPVTPRRHAFELLPGIGSKHMQKLVDERETGDFESLEDVEERVPSVPEPQEALKERIINEMKGETKHKLLTS